MKKKRLLFIFPIIIVLVAASAFGYIYSYIAKWDGRIYPQSYVGGNDVSGLTVGEAREVVLKNNNNLLSRRIKVICEQKVYDLTYEDIKVEVDLEDTINAAYKYGKEHNIFGKINTLRGGNRKNYDMTVKCDPSSIKSFIEKVKNDINREPVNAAIIRIEKGTPVISKEITGRKVIEEELYNSIIKSIAYNSKDEVVCNVKVQETKPVITEEILKPVNTLVSTVTTYYLTSSVGRAENILIAADKLNGRLIMPGEEFSFNKETGARTLENGFKGAPVIVKGKLVDGVAGGVCQVSTTLYNAIIKLGIKSLERRNHSLAPAYIAPGFDATVAEYIDYKFKNTMNYPLYIESKAGQGKITFNIYSNNSLSEIKYKLENEVVEVMEPEIIYNSVDTLPKGTIEKVQDPVKGYKVKVYLVAYKNGKEIKRELLSKDNYKKVDGVYNVGI